MPAQPAGAATVAWRVPSTYRASVDAAASNTPVSWYHWPTTGSKFAEATTPSAGASPARRVKANRRESSRNCRKKLLTWFPSMLTNVWKPDVLSSLTQLLTEKLFVVSSTGAPASAKPLAPSVVRAPPRMPGPQPAPPFRVAGCSPAVSAAVVPLPSSNVQCPASAGSASATAAVTGMAENRVRAASTARGRRNLRSMTLLRV